MTLTDLIISQWDRMSESARRGTTTIVLFRSAFRLDGSRGGEESPNITHALRPDGSATLCGRRGWATEETSDASAADVDCLRCRMRALNQVLISG